MKLFTLCTAILLISAAAFAAPQEKNGFSGYLDAGIFGMSSTDTLMVSDNNEEIDSLGDSSDRFGKAILALLFEVKYKKDSLTYHLGVPAGKPKPEFELGVTKEFGVSSVDVSLVADPMGEVWKDPYVSDRRSTDAYSTGVKVTWNEIAGTPHYAEFSVISHEIDDDLIGERFDSMKRDGYTSELAIGYKYRSESGIMTPVIALKHDHRDGDAQSSKGAELKFIFVKPSKKALLIAAATAGYDKFDETNPIFDKTREDFTLNAFTNYKWLNPFGLQNKHISFTAGVSDRISNIDFYDAVTLFGGVTFGISF